MSDNRYFFSSVFANTVPTYAQFAIGTSDVRYTVPVIAWAVCRVPVLEDTEHADTVTDVVGLIAHEGGVSLVRVDDDMLADQFVRYQHHE